MDIAWFYKQFDTSLKCLDKDGKKYTLPMELDAKMLFKANGSDNKKYSTVLSINTINRHVPLCPSSLQLCAHAYDKRCALWPDQLPRLGCRTAMT